jgi:hypothetical protein
LLSLANKFDWARNFLTFGVSTFLDDDTGMSPLSILDSYVNTSTSHSQCPNLPPNLSSGVKVKEKGDLEKKKNEQEEALSTEKGGCKKKSGSKRVTPVVDT